MKIIHRWFSMCILFFSVSAHAEDLIQVYTQAQQSDPIFQEAISQRCATKQGVPISVAALLPNLSATISPNVSRTGVAGSLFEPVAPSTGSVFTNPRNNTVRYYQMSLTLSQTVFNFAQFAAVASQVALSKGADATLNATLQDLMVRVATAYFSVLRDEDNLRFSNATKEAFAKQFDQISQQYQVGLKTLTDVYTAKASYDTAVANYIAAQTTLSNDRENLRVLTGIYYKHLTPLSEKFPLLSPEPLDVEAWVKRAYLQNWSVKAAQFNLENLRQQINQQFSGHLPTVDMQAFVTRSYINNINEGRNFNERPGPGTSTVKELALSINVPIFSGGGVVALTNQAIYNFQVGHQQLEQATRNVVNTTRQTYLNVVAGISKIKADMEAIKSTVSSLEGLKEGYHVGTQTLVDVVNQQEKVFEAQTQYATDRYNFVINILLLKQAAGTLCFDDLHAINAWLSNDAKDIALLVAEENNHNNNNGKVPEIDYSLTPESKVINPPPAVVNDDIRTEIKVTPSDTDYPPNHNNHVTPRAKSVNANASNSSKLNTSPVASHPDAANRKTSEVNPHPKKIIHPKKSSAQYISRVRSVPAAT